MPETQQLDAPERSDDEISIVEDHAAQLPGVPVTQLDSDGCDALEQKNAPVTTVNITSRK